MPDTYNPAYDFSPNARDHFAMMEHSSPIITDSEEMARFLGVDRGVVERLGKKAHARALAKWRYMVANEMIRMRES